MPVYNGVQFLNQSIESILNQTFDNFEFMIIDDGSTDQSLDLIRKYDDSRINLIINNENLGQCATMNHGIRLATGQYIARIDQDDISLPRRLEMQAQYFLNHPEVGVLGCHAKIVDKNLKTVLLKSRPTTNNENKWRLLYSTSVMHPSAMFRKSIIDKYGGYNQKFSPAEDYELWSRLSQHTEIHQLSDYLILRRLHENSTSSLNRSVQYDSTNQIRNININRLFSNNIDSNKFEDLVNYLSGRYENSKTWWINVSRDIIQMYIVYCTGKRLKKNEIVWIVNDWIKLMVHVPPKYRMMALIKYFIVRIFFGYEFYLPTVILIKNDVWKLWNSILNNIIRFGEERK